jgi:CRISPR system Cascade subunit CasE
MSLWLARIPLDLRSRPVRNDLADAAAMHRRVMSVLPDGLGPQARQIANVLYRLDHTADGPVLLVQSGYDPDPLRLPAGYVRAAGGEPAGVRKLEPLLNSLQAGCGVHYRLAANASKRRNNNDDRSVRGPVVALDGRAAEEWWERKADRHGMRLLSLRADAQPSARGGLSRMRHAITRFDGQAVVEDPDKLRAAVAAGIGRGKAYGCGLLSLAPIRTR